MRARLLDAVLLLVATALVIVAMLWLGWASWIPLVLVLIVIATVVLSRRKLKSG